MMAEYIEREYLLYEFREIMPEMGVDELADEIYDIALNVEATDVVPVVHGQWLEYPRAHYFKCSNCKYTVPYKKAVLIGGKREYNYCPHCGARMDFEEGMRIFDFKREVEWNPAPLNGQKISTYFKIKNRSLS